MSTRSTKQTRDAGVPRDAITRIASRAGVPVAHVVEVFEERIAMMTEDGTMSESAATIAALSDVAAVFERGER